MSSASYFLLLIFCSQSPRCERIKRQELNGKAIKASSSTATTGKAPHRLHTHCKSAIKWNMEVENYGNYKQMLERLLSVSPARKQEELRGLVELCVQRGTSNKSIDLLEDPSQLCSAILSRLSTIGSDVCDLCGEKFYALSWPGCIICGKH